MYKKIVMLLAFIMIFSVFTPAFGQRDSVSEEGKEILNVEDITISNIPKEEMRTTLDYDFYEREPNDSFELADRIELDWLVYGSITEDFYGWEYYYDVDYYRLDINKSGTLYVFGLMEYNFYTQYLGIELYKSTNTFGYLTNSNLYYIDGRNYQVLEYDVTPGTYYIVVYPDSNYYF